MGIFSRSDPLPHIDIVQTNHKGFQNREDFFLHEKDKLPPGETLFKQNEKPAFVPDDFLYFPNLQQFRQDFNTFQKSIGMPKMKISPFMHITGKIYLVFPAKKNYICRFMFWKFFGDEKMK